MTICVVPSAPLSICYRPVASLVPDPRNARTHPKRQVEQIAASIREFGFANPILVDADDTIIAGHGRLLAAKALGMTEVPTIVLRHLSEAQKRALRIADNRIALGAGWDLDLLKLELGELAVLDVDLDLALTGFSSGEIDVILKGPADPEDEVIPAVPATPRTRPGDIWILGEHRVGCGDGRDLAFLQAVVGDGAVVDAAFLDPPYNVRINGHANAKEAVGYCRPPEASRFRKGQSGNARGRPRGKHRAPPYEAVLGQMVTIREDGTERRVTAAEAFLLQITKKGLEGDGAATRAAMGAIEEARAIRLAREPQEQLTITRVIVRPGSVNSALEPLRMGRKLDRYRETARIGPRALARRGRPRPVRRSPADARGADDGGSRHSHPRRGCDGRAGGRSGAEATAREHVSASAPPSCQARRARGSLRL